MVLSEWPSYSYLYIGGLVKLAGDKVAWSLRALNAVTGKKIWATYSEVSPLTDINPVPAKMTY